VITIDLRLGLSLIFVSVSVLTSVVIAPLLPSFLKTAYPSIGQPPLSAGSYQARVNEVKDEVTLLGAYILEGEIHA
jgi:hypothetical protein